MVAPAPVAAAPAESLTLERAFDFIHEQLGTGTEPILSRVERELITRALAAEGGDSARAAQRLGLTKAALLRKSKVVDL